MESGDVGWKATDDGPNDAKAIAAVTAIVVDFIVITENGIAKQDGNVVDLNIKD